jgi:F-type H+-transporting ATPase subunit b
MKRLLLLVLLSLGVTTLLATPLRAAEGAAKGDEASSPVYSVNEGIITGVATIVIFILLVAILGKYAWGPILSGLKAREDKIRKDIADAEETRAKAEATLRQYNDQLATAEQKVRDLLNNATTDAENLAASIRTRGQQEAEEIKDRATRDIDAAREQALTEIYEKTADLATRVAEKILRRNLNADDQRSLVNESLQELQTAGAK